MDIELLKRNVWDVAPTANGSYLTRRADEARAENGPTHTSETKQIPGFKILLVRPESLDHLRKDTLKA